jgi:hypothetical protein
VQQTTNSQPELPSAVREQLEHFCNQIRVSLAGNLVSAIAYGDAVRNPETPPKNVNVMIVFKSMNVETLDQLTGPIQGARRSFRLSPLILTEEDLYSSTDVFPVKFINMQRHYRVLVGKDVLTNLVVGVDHLRLRCEQEIKNLMLRLRSFYVQNAQHPLKIRDTLMTATASLLTSFSALLILKNEPVPDSNVELIDKAAEILSLNTDSVKAVFELSKQSSVDAARVRQLYESFMEMVRSTAKIIDSLDTGSADG